MRTTVDLEPSLLKRLRDEAHRQGLSMKEFLNRVVQRGLDERPSATTKPYRCPTVAMGAPRRSLDKALALADALEDQEIAQKLALRR